MTYIKYSIGTDKVFTISFENYEDALTEAIDYLQSGYTVQIIQD